ASGVPDGSTAADLRVHTDHADLAVRWPSSDGATVVYAHGGDLFRLDPSGGPSRRIPIELRGQRAERQRRFPSPVRNLEGWDLHPDGHSLALTVRGRPITLGTWEGPVRQHGVRDGVRYRLARWIDAERLLVTTDEGGEEALEALSVTTSERRRYDGLDHGRVLDLAIDPTGRRAALSDHRNALHVLDLVEGTLRTVDRSSSGAIAGFDWSADGRWLAWSVPLGRGASRAAIRLCDVPGLGEPVDVTSGLYNDLAPSFDPDGHHLYFLSHREFDPVRDALHLDYAFPRAIRPYLVTLRKADRDPFQPDPRPLKGKHAHGERAVDATIDLDGLADRIVPFPLPEGRYEQIVGVGHGQVLLTRAPLRGMRDRTWYEPGPPKADLQLLVWEFDKQESTELNPRISEIRVDRKRDQLAIRAGARLRVVPSRPDKGAREELRKTEGRTDRKAGWIDLGRIRIPVEPGAEWGQMVREAWRLARDHFWDPSLGGLDWTAIGARYAGLVDRVACRSELSDLVWCLQGELGTSHAYEMGGDYASPPSWRIGRLGADVAWDGAAGGWRIERVIRGEPGDPDRSSPLGGPGIGVEAGAVITAVGGQPVGAERPLDAALVHQAGAPVVLSLRDRAGARDVVVRTLADDRDLRYRDWVVTNRRRVHAATDGRIGYVHVPDMGPNGFAEFHRDYYAEAERAGMIVDVRHNRGGHVSALLLTTLARPRLGYKVSRWFEPYPYPADTVAGPLVALANEMAGSDGDIFTHAWKQLGLGPVIGTRTWGGVVGLRPNQLLVDRAITTQPEFATWFPDVGYGLENHGTEPDIEVHRTPDDWAAGRDPQLDRGIAVALERLAATPPAEHPVPPRPPNG
ncbi:MAG: S41 family peptidase, partial [Myxococcota bacterium]